MGSSDGKNFFSMDQPDREHPESISASPASLHVQLHLIDTRIFFFWLSRSNLTFQADILESYQNIPSLQMQLLRKEGPKTEGITKFRTLEDPADGDPLRG